MGMLLSILQNPNEERGAEKEMPSVVAENKFGANIAKQYKEDEDKG